MTKLLVLSDSHGGRAAIERVLMKESKSIDALIFLGDGLRDLELALTLYPKLRAYSVAGNCDYGALEPTDGLAAFDGVVIFYTHGHMYGVKYDLDTLADAASARGAEVALFGHTHIPHAETRSKVFLFNPGSCGRCYTGPDKLQKRSGTAHGAWLCRAGCGGISAQKLPGRSTGYPYLQGRRRNDQPAGEPAERQCR